MIQRIQSVYLLFVLIAFVILGLGVDVITTTTSQKGAFTVISKTNMNGIQHEISFFEGINSGNLNALQKITGSDIKTTDKYAVTSLNLPIYIACALLGIFSIVVLFGYKNIKRQLRWSKLLFLFNLVFVLAYSGGLWYVFYILQNEFPNTDKIVSQIDFQVGAYCLVAILIFSFMAKRAIKKDVQLIKSVDRIR